jgi:hypothetical protein
MTIQSQRITCCYCNTSNSPKASTCIACGAPLEGPTKTNPEPLPARGQISAQKSPTAQTRPEENLRKIGEQADDVYFTLWNTYAIAWRTIGEVIAIALTGAILGLVGGATGLWFPGILGAIFTGIAVGFTWKQFYVVLISAPAGLLVGLGLGAMIWALGGGPGVLVYTGMLFAILGAVLGGKHNLPFAQRNCWEKARPFLGAMGGWAFGAFGALIGWGISAVIEILLNSQ